MRKPFKGQFERCRSGRAAEWGGLLEFLGKASEVHGAAGAVRDLIILSRCELAEEFSLRSWSC